MVTMVTVTLEIGMRILSLKESIARVSKTTNTMNAAFSKSVSCTCKWARKREEKQRKEKEEIKSSLDTRGTMESCPYQRGVFIGKRGVK